MTILKFLGVSLLVIVIAVIVVGGYFINSVGNTLSEGCERIAQIAKDKEVVAYLDNWVTEHVIDKGYYLVTGMHGDITAHSIDGNTINLGIPDEKKSLIESSFLRFGLKKTSGNFEDPITSKNVGLIRFGRGRNSIILLKNNQTLESHRGYTEASAHLLKINNSLFAYCADARF